MHSLATRYVRTATGAALAGVRRPTTLRQCCSASLNTTRSTQPNSSYTRCPYPILLEHYSDRDDVVERPDAHQVMTLRQLCSTSFDTTRSTLLNFSYPYLRCSYPIRLHSYKDRNHVVKIIRYSRPGRADPSDCSLVAQQENKRNSCCMSLGGENICQSRMV